MKRFFTVIAAMTMAVSVNAQGTYAVANGETYVPEQKITSVSNIEVSYMAPKDDTFNSSKKQENWADGDFTYYASIASGKGAKFTEGSEPTGAFLKFNPTLDGVIVAAIQIDKNKGLCLVGPDLKKSMNYTYNLPSAKNEESQTLATNDKGQECLAKKSNGTVTFKVEGGKTYYLMALGSKIGFFGFKYSLPASAEVTISDAGYATYAAPYAVDYAANNLEAYTVSYANGKLTYNKVEGVVAAKLGVIVKGAAGTHALTKAEGEATVTETGLKVADTPVKGGSNIYCLANKDKGLGFYQVASDVDVPAGKAYLEIPATAEARDFFSLEIGGETTGIQAAWAVAKADGTIYSLSGQKVNKAYKGIVIVNGKKMIQK